MKIVFSSPDANPAPWLDALAAALPEAALWAWSPQNAARQADYAVVWAPTAEMLASQHSLKAVFNIGAGVDGILKLPELPRLLGGALIVRLNDAGMAAQMAEYVCHEVIHHTRDFARYEAQQRESVWKRLAPIHRADWPVGVMGLGSIGQRVAQALAAFDYPVMGWSRGHKSLAGIHTFAGHEELDSFLAATRILVCVLPHTADTAGILNAAALGRLQAGAYVVNVARGAHLVEEDLLAQLASGHVAGASLDVFREEPLPAAHPFWCHPRVRITPHVSAITLRTESAAQIAAKIRALQAGAMVDGIVDLARGY